ncbi:hypothetical protein L6452_28211 [Arctium lappa]|uniref:Uncharacterized protein n=1 Tax=Arctium lappa TaxID=4217 RepID=A0ACB8ZY28_ARCLA|nr:hypothetical protein L6452_28211 [Arctium lappa]
MRRQIPVPPPPLLHNRLEFFQSYSTPPPFGVVSNLALNFHPSMVDANGKFQPCPPLGPQWRRCTRSAMADLQYSPEKVQVYLDLI